MANIKDEFKPLSYNEVYDILQNLAASKEIAGKFIVGGGTVPYLLTNTDSNREHGDIDIMVKLQDMSAIRRYLKKNNLYDKRYDSLFYETGNVDHGVIANINGLSVEFDPYQEVIDKTTGQKSIVANTFTFNKDNNELNLKYNYIKGLTEEDAFVETQLNNGAILKTFAPEMIAVMKASIDKSYIREKDKADLIALKGCNLNLNKLTKIYNSFHDKGTSRSVVSNNVDNFTLQEIIDFYTPKIEPVSKEEIEDCYDNNPDIKPDNSIEIVKETPDKSQSMQHENTNENA